MEIQDTSLFTSHLCWLSGIHNFASGKLHGMLLRNVTHFELEKDATKIQTITFIAAITVLKRYKEKY